MTAAKIKIRRMAYFLWRANIFESTTPIFARSTRTTGNSKTRPKASKNLMLKERYSFMLGMGLMKSVDVMIGNSSSGIIEAPSFHLPVINIGTRQQGRERSINIIDIQPEKDTILSAINFALYDHKFLKKVQQCENNFGDGHASERIERQGTKWLMLAYANLEPV